MASPSTQRIDALLKLTRDFDDPAIAHQLIQSPGLIVLPGEGSLVHDRRLALDPPGMMPDVGRLFERRTAAGSA